MDGLKILTRADGRPRSSFWYARFTRDGQKVDVSLGVKIKGVVPVDERGRVDVARRGDAAFEKSRQAARDALAKMRKAASVSGKTDAMKSAETADLVRRYYKARTGKGIDGVKLSELGEMWRSLERSYTPTAERTREANAVFSDFARFARGYCRDHGGRCETLDEITADIAKSWFSELRRGYSWGTVRGRWQLMRKSWTRWHVCDGKNPFSAVVVRNGGGYPAKVERRPLTELELSRLFDETRDDPALHALVVTCACTGMRIGDVCRLKWESVDLKRGLIDATTAKAGVRVTVPIFAPLLQVLRDLDARRAVGDSPFVFPVAADRYTHKNAGGFNDRRTGLFRAIKPYLAKAIFPEGGQIDAIPAVAEHMSRRAVLSAIDKAGFSTAKRERVRSVFVQWSDGIRCIDIAKAMNIARGQVSDYLKEVERLTGETYRPRIERKRASGKTGARDLVELTRQKRKVGRYSASLYGWHNLRHTFVVLALQSGVPVNDVSRIVGHGDVETTLNNYGNTSREFVAERARRQMERRGLVLAAGAAVPVIGDAGCATDGAEWRAASDRLRELKKLVDAGLITPEEYAEKRAAAVAAL